MNNKSVLPRDPFDALLMQNDVVGVRLWGPPTQPTLSVGKSDIWDRRWFGDRQPLVTMARIRELAMAGRLSEVARDPNDTVYDVYGQYDFPCPKPGAQVILGTPFAENATVERFPDGGFRLFVEGKGKRLTAHTWVMLTRPLVAIQFQCEGLEPADLWIRVYRHRDTILPGEPMSPTLGGRPSNTDFEQMAAPVCHKQGNDWGIVQRFPPESTFPNGFDAVVAATADGAEPVIESKAGEKGLGTPLWAEKEGRLDHMVIKRYRPINEAIGAASIASFRALPASFCVYVAIVTTQDDPNPASLAANILKEARELGVKVLLDEQKLALERCRRKNPATACVGESRRIEAPARVLPNLRRPLGCYGDIPLCSVGDTKFCFQDAGLWHNDFHLNEIRAEGMLTLGQFEEILLYCDLIRTLLPQAQENARDVYGLPGAMYPLVHFPLRCRGIAHTNLTWEQDIGLNGLVSKPLWLYFRYTGDKVFLEQTGYPVLRECARFCLAYLSEGDDGWLHMIPTVSPEHWGLTAKFERNRDCASALTLTRYLLMSAFSAAETLGQDLKEAAEWKKAAVRLTPYPTHMTDKGPVWVDVLGAPPIEYNVPVPLSPVFWGDDVGLDSPTETVELAKRTLEQINVWPPHRFYLDSCIRPRLGICGPGAPIGAENLLLSYQSIRIFPAAPHDVEIRMENFAAQGGFRVWAVRPAKGEMRDVKILSVLGGECRVANPWPGRAVRVTSAAGRQSVRLTGAAEQIVFSTTAGADYELSPE
ncbi:MAG: hypothetical protein KKG09_03680 [Verrucomicrobia bacterium]|nr:hypothetical protein [Verrucomicrobiota bacterium]MCG2678942.1 hypothetical protein [Kiritimatiellia bacterium]MBU4248279.1 hypothetical protein [Verrucomicrobiota bacterium]MBU4291768.1 hypothetical protein [Verrucomicrobiota bacterium]MBU4429618.1 hypothetical protein [Verrucomicrobiota bacterium]